MACNFALLALGSNGRYSDIRKLVDVLQRNALANEHTYGAAVSALDQAGRFDMAIQYFEELYRCAALSLEILLSGSLFSHGSGNPLSPPLNAQHPFLIWVLCGVLTPLCLNHMIYPLRLSKQ